MQILSPIHILFFDDICRFPLHLSRYLGFELSFGIGKIPFSGPNPKDQNPIFWKKAGSNFTPQEFKSDNGCVYLWWIPAVDKGFNNIDLIDWRQGFDLVMNKIIHLGNFEPSRLIFILDVRGKQSKKNPKKNPKRTNEPYSVKSVIREIIAKGILLESPMDKKPNTGRSPVYVVSSYVVDKEEEYPVHPKTPNTFRDIQRRVLELEKNCVNHHRPKKSFNRKEINILVTGAGFEVSKNKPPEKIKTGLDSTWELLTELPKPFQISNNTFSKCDPDGKLSAFKVPTVLHKCDKECKEVCTKLPNTFYFKLPKQDLKFTGNLDEVWSVLIWDIINPLLLPTDTSGHSGCKIIEMSVKSAELEYRLRDAFRKKILDYDWGFMRQSIIAAQLNWDTWLTTNYTQFADRAIQAVERLGEGLVNKKEMAYEHISCFGQTQIKKAPPENAKLWRIIGTTNAAERLQVGKLHLKDHDEEVGRKMLFKLHGDIGHLHTMAIAGHDKMPTSPLSMKMDSMHKIYAAAQQHLSQKSSANKDTTINWHVVGHGLKDALLTNLMLSHDNNRMNFILVSPNSSKELKVTLSELRKGNESNIHTVKATAAEYMSKLFAYSKKGKILSFSAIKELFPEPPDPKAPS